MSRFCLAVLSCLSFLSVSVQARANDLISVKSIRPVKETLDRLQKIVTDDGYSVVARVPHSDAAKKAELDLRPTELMIFGKPRSGTPIMVCNQSAGIDLPLRALAWKDQEGQVWLAMVDPQVLKQRYALGDECDGVIVKMTGAVKALLANATAP